MKTNEVKAATEKMQRPIKILSVISILFCLLWVVSDCLLLYQNYTVPGKIHFWDDAKFGQHLFLIGSPVLAAVLAALLIVLIVKVLRLMKEGRFFSTACSRILYWWAGIYFFYSTFKSSVKTMHNDDYSAIVMEGDTFLIPVLIMLLAYLFKVATAVSEDSSLSI